MDILFGVTIVVIYAAIGTFMGELVIDGDEDASIWVMILWPIVFLGGLILFATNTLPIRLARWIKNKK